MAGCQFTWHLVAPYAVLQRPRSEIGLPLCHESALFPGEQTVSALAVGACFRGRQWANHRKWKWEGNSDGAGARCFAIPLVMKCHNRAFYCSAAGVSYNTPMSQGCPFDFLLDHLQVCFFDLRLGCICLLFFSPWAASMLPCLLPCTIRIVKKQHGSLPVCFVVYY